MTDQPPAPAEIFTARIGAGPGFPAPDDLPLLVAAEQAGFMPPSSCRNGTCRTCIGQLESGRVRYRIQWPGLSAEEKAEGYLLPCVAYPLGDVVLRLSGVQSAFDRANAPTDAPPD